MKPTGMMFSPMLAVPCFQNINPKHLAGCGLAGGWSLHLATGLIAGAFQIVQALKPITMMRACVCVRVAGRLAHFIYLI